MGYHQILRVGFEMLHGKGSTTMSERDDITGTELIEAQAGDSTELYRKVMRVKAGKTFDWLKNNNSVYDVFLSVLSVSPMEHIMHQFMKWQETEADLREIDPPMVVMTSAVRSPACIGMREILSTMFSGQVFSDGDSAVSIDAICNGCLATVHHLSMFSSVFPLPCRWSKST